MAPGCFGTYQLSQQEHSKHNQNYTNFDLKTSNEKNLLEKNNLILSNDAPQINLDEIPLPSTPPLELNQKNLQTVTNENNLSEDKNNSNLSRKTKINCSKIRKTSLDTIDSFEILEQTIIKQKRLGRLKRYDLRKKILLKRTFDLICDIMENENEIENDLDEDYKSDNLENSDKKISECNEQLLPLETSPNINIIKLEDENLNIGLCDPDDFCLNVELVEFKFDDLNQQKGAENNFDFHLKTSAQVPIRCLNEDDISNINKIKNKIELEQYLYMDQQLDFSNLNQKYENINLLDLDFYNDLENNPPKSKRSINSMNDHMLETFKTNKKPKV